MKTSRQTEGLKEGQKEEETLFYRTSLATVRDPTNTNAVD